jgi:hypothetical protein
LLSLLAIWPMLISAVPGSRTIPVLLLSDAEPVGCRCAPLVELSFLTGGTGACSGAGAPAPQPCFQASIEGEPHLKDKHGVCVALAIPGEPPVPACGPKKACVFEPREIKISAAVCANICNAGPYQVYDPAVGEELGGPFGTQPPANYAIITKVVGNRPCNTTKDYVIVLKAAGDIVAASWQIRAVCGQCPRLVPPPG